MLAVLGYMHEWNSGHLFVGVRNVDEDFFTSDVTALFQNSSEGIFPTVASSYPIANYPYSGLTLYFDVTKGKWTSETVCIMVRDIMLESPRQSFPGPPEEGWNLQYVAVGVQR